MIPDPPQFPPRPAASPAPEAHRPQLATRITTQTSPTLPPRHKRFRPTAPPPFPPGVTPTRRQFSARAASGSQPLARPARWRAFPPRLSARARWRLFARAMPVGCRAPSTTPVRHARHHAYLSPLTPQPDGCLSFEQFNECGVLPNRFGRTPLLLKVSSWGGVAAGVSGGREDDAADGTGQGSGPVLGAPPVAQHRVEHAAGWDRSATLNTPHHAAPGVPT
jgi:hypothetical protein